MAGSIAATIHEHHRGNEAASEYSRWMIGFARFVQYPFSPSPCPGLFPLGKKELNQRTHGTWLSSSSSTVSLQMVDDLNRFDVILSVELGEKVLEEHYISKLNFSWPQMSCVSGFPTRGSRAIIISYNDSENEIQKFGLRFSTCDAAETFVVALKEKLKVIEEAGNHKSETRSEVSFQPDYYPSKEIVPRAMEEEPNMVKPLNSYVPEMLPRLEYETGQTLYQPQSTLNQIPNETSINLPPSFTTLLSSCFPNSTLDAGQTIVKQEPDLKSQIMKYMEDSSFQDMLQKVERIIDEVGDTWIL